jgi:hypothetical protein
LVPSLILLVRGETDSIKLEPIRVGYPQHGIPSNVYNEGENITIICSRFYVNIFPISLNSLDDAVAIYNSTELLDYSGFMPGGIVRPYNTRAFTWYYYSSRQITWTAPNCTSGMPEQYSVVFRGSATFNFTVKPLNWVY